MHTRFQQKQLQTRQNLQDPRTHLHTHTLSRPLMSMERGGFCDVEKLIGKSVMSVMM